MLPNQSPAEGDRCDRPDDDTTQWDVTTPRWVVGDEFLFQTFKDTDKAGPDWHDTWAAAVHAATQVSLRELGDSMYIWRWPHPPGERKVTAIAVNGELFFQREAFALLENIESSSEGVGEASPKVNRHSTSPTNGLRSAFPWTFTDNGESTMDIGLTKREHFTLELAKSMVNAVYPISHNGPNQFIDMRWPLIRDGAIRMSADLLAALAGETFEGDPPCEQLLAELRGNKT